MAVCKKNNCLTLLALSVIMLLSGCFAEDTTTDHARNYVYKAGETINFYNEQKNREHLGSLTFGEVHVLSEEKFTQKEDTGNRDEDGNVIYEDMTYRQIVQIDYIYEPTSAGKELGGNNLLSDFKVYDSSGAIGFFNPDAPYEAVPVPETTRSFIVALKNKSDTFKVNVYYSGVFSANAVAVLSLGEDVTFTGKSQNQQNVVSDKQYSQLEKEIKNANSKNSLYRTVIIVLLVVGFVLLSVAVVFASLWSFEKKKRKK